METKLKYYLQIADSAAIMSRRMLEASKDAGTCPPFTSSLTYATQLNHFANEIYVETASWENENRLLFSHWLSHRQSHELFNCLLVELSIQEDCGRRVQNLFFETYLYLFLFESFCRKDAFLKQVSEKYLPVFYQQLLQTQNSFNPLNVRDAEQKLKIQEFVLSLWTYVDDLFQVSIADIEMYACQKGVDFAELRKNWEKSIGLILEPIHVSLPIFESLPIIGKEGQHTKDLDAIL